MRAHAGRATRRFAAPVLSPIEVERNRSRRRDGSVADLETCVRQHIAEMQIAGRQQLGGCGPVTIENPILAQMPERLRPTYGSVTAIPRPPELNEDEVSDLMMFLGSLSARRQGR